MNLKSEYDITALNKINFPGGHKRELMASLRYARYIQSAMLPSFSVFEQIFPESFIIFEPRDIVSGDFYWVIKKKGVIFLAVADCTGHGVPGALMSIMGISFLNEIVSRDKLLSASAILNLLREKVMKALHQTGDISELKDGMDLALCIIDKENEQLEFSGANHYVYLIRNDKLTRLKGDRMPIGINAVEEHSFTGHTMKLFKGDRLYLFTDGYVDQFGGPREKKLKYGPFRDLLYKNHQKPMREQKTILEKAFNNWKGKLDQVDDVLVVGIKI